ncbi:MAG TPA: helix-turn-helix transcriptional regulator [Alphaproteobacteria bacterium]|nr:helix-turn-helix transcriptional regulator [Alphaproteobacteria bacterium]
MAVQAKDSPPTDGPLNVAEFSDLVKTVYAGPLEDPPWSSFLDAICTRLGGLAVTLILEPPASEGPGYILNAAGRVHSGWRSYRDRFFASDPFVDLPEGKPVTLSEFLPQEEFQASEFNRLFLKPTGVRYILGVDVRAESDIRARFRVSRGENAADFGAEERSICALLLPHLRQAVEIYARMSRIASEKTLYAGTLNQMAVGTIIVDDHGRILDRDPVAEGLIKDADGVSSVNGMLSLSDRTASARFHEALRKIAESERKGERALVEAIRAERPSGKRDFGLIVKPAPQPRYLDEQHIPAIVVFISDPDRHTAMAPAALAKLFGLTPAEAGFAVLLGDGLTLDEAAMELSIARNTARAHLRSIFAKTGVSRQTQLVRLIVTSLAQLGSAELE